MNILDVAFKEYGIKEIVGKKHNPRILEYFAEIGHKWVRNDEMAWCSAFINYCAKIAGFEYTGKLNARSWLKVGEETKQPNIGDVVVFWRGSKTSWKGHVALFISERNGYTYVLGGNQNNQVNIRAYPTSRVLGYRKLNKLQTNFVTF